MTDWVPNVSSSSDPIYLAIAKALADDVADGRLQPGDRLPTHRELARALNLSIGTVTRGYIEAERRGVIRGETGRGTFVRDPKAEQPTPFSRSPMGPTLIEMSVNYPLYSEDPDLAAALAALSRRDVSELLRYRSARPQARYLEVGATWLRSFGLEADPESVVITAGAQHALTVILLSIAKAGNLVFADELTYPGLIALGQLCDCRLQGIAMDDAGMIPDALLAACRQRKAQVLYCMPTLHNATSTILTAERRRRLAGIAREYDLLVIEDETNRPWVRDAPPPLAHHIPERTFFIASTSKVLAGGLRVAYVAAPALMRQKLEHGIWATAWMPSPLAVELTTMWIENQTAWQTSARKRREIEARQQIARDILGEYPYKSHPAAYSLWMQLPPEWTSDEFTVEAARRGVSISPSGVFVVPPLDAPNAIRISVGAAENRDQLKAGLGIIAQMLRDGKQCPTACV